MYIPRHHHWAGPAALIAAGFAAQNYICITHGIRFAWDAAVLVQLPLDVAAVFYGAYLYRAGVIWQEFEKEWNAPGDKKQTAPAVTSVPYNDMGRRTVLQLAQVTEALKISNEQKFYRALIDMRNGGLPVDMRESYWISPVNRYGESRDNFVAMKDDGVRFGALSRAGERKNAPHVVADWRKVRLKAGGYSLPRRPQS